MRFLMPLLVLVCSLHLAAQSPQEPEAIEINSFDYGSMLQVSSALLSNHFGQRLEAMMESGNETQLIPANDDEKMALVVSFTYFLIAVARMHQEVACLSESKNALEMLNVIWNQGSALFGLVPEDLQKAAVGTAMQWLEEHGEDEWQPLEHVELYKAASEWHALRTSCVERYYQFLGQSLQEA